jgi:1,4-alpha-glucan branching enzyme
LTVQEFLEWGAWSDARELDWSKAARFAGIRAFYRDLIRLRRNWYDSTRGLRGHEVNVHHVNDRNKVIAFHRWDRGGPRDDVVVVMNFANRS